MSKKFKAQASSARAASTLATGVGFGSSLQTTSSPLSYITELPDLSQVTEPNIVVSLKNLGKKDSTTKAKALEELQEYCQGDVEQPVLQAWADLYPRMSIDNSRRVRQLAHSIQGNFTISAGKRIAPLLPKVIGSWLAGTFDSDKSVARTAQDALYKSFTTPDKRKAIWSIYKGALFTYVEDATMIQSPSTLSDERSTSADDAQTKYTRVVGTAVSILGQLLNFGVQDDLVSVLLGGKKLWEFVYHEDSYLRRSVCELVIIACGRETEKLDWSSISTCFLSKGLQSDQMASSRQYTSALIALTKQRPELWTSDYTAKTSIFKRLIQFLKRGSQSGSEVVWANITALIEVIPVHIWNDDNADSNATNMAESLRNGISLPSERGNSAIAWTSYAQICFWIYGILGSHKAEFLGIQMAPVVKHYVTRKEDQNWTIISRGLQICKDIMVGFLKRQELQVFDSAWGDITSTTVDEMRLSQPETSENFKKSQDAVIDQTKRLLALKSEVRKYTESSQAITMLQEVDGRMIASAIQLLKTRVGKPYSAAAMIELIVEQSGFDMQNHVLQAFVRDNLRSLLDSPSAEYLAAIALRAEQAYVLDELMSRRSVHLDRALYSTLARVEPKYLTDETATRLLEGGLDDGHLQRVYCAIMQNPSLHQLSAMICERLVKALDSDSVDLQTSGLDLLGTLLSQPSSTNILASDSYRSTLLTRILVISESGTGLAEKAGEALAKLNGTARSSTSSASIIQAQLNGEGTPLSIFTLVDLGTDAAQNGAIELNGLLPSNEAWNKALMPHMTSARPYDMSVTSPLQGVLYTINVIDTNSCDVPVRDADDFSMAFRLVLYATKMLTSDFAFNLEGDHLKSQYEFYPLALQLVNEKLTMDNANEIWIRTTPEVIQEAVDILSDGNRLIRSWLGQENFIEHWSPALHRYTAGVPGISVKSLAWISIMSHYVDQHGPAQIFQQYENQLKKIHKSEHLVQSASLVAVLRESFTATPDGKKALNELVADITTLKNASISPLVLLNVLLRGDAEALQTIPTQRVVFLLKSLVRLLGDRETLGMRHEALKILTAITPLVHELYGEHWEQMLTGVIQMWSTGVAIPVMNASVQLSSKLKLLVNMEDVNEDLVDAWRSSKPELDLGLLECLQELNEAKLEVDQPRDITAEIIRRQLRDVEIKDYSKLFNMLASPILAVQNTAFEGLHRTIPTRQEQLSVELILENRKALLPEDLMVVISDDHLQDRRYLLAWVLVFDHFSRASYRLREAYTASIKSSGHINALLMYICDALKIVGGRSIDASKFDIAEFEVETAESDEKELQWLAVHNYYCALLWVPSLAKDWFLLQKNRVKTPLEVWTQKYISPAIVSASLRTVTDWASAQSQNEDERVLTVKTSPRGSELTAAVAVDPESPPISLAISLPGAYPLESPTVSSRTRVGVSEKNWQSWLRTIQIIVFSTGSIIEGLVAFRRNVQGALKGQSECAICYSIIGTDMQTPTKKCGTCKNMFHGTCLFRWFKSSNSSSCPLCRNNFNYA